MKVVTLNATYNVDLERMKVTRTPADRGIASSPMRRDEEELTLLAVPTPVIGERMEMLLDLREDGALTVRSTSQVTEITR